jgi:monofunctional chorismate mutase
MSKLDESRVKIDEIDTQIIELYEKRMQIVKDVIQYKIENNMAILDSNREAAMLEKNLQKIKNEELKKYYKSVLDGYLKASKDMQKDILEQK